jgi:hypothetical protein
MKEFVQKIAQIKLHGGFLDTFCQKPPGYTYHPGKPLSKELPRKKKNFMCLHFCFHGL